ncbi:hypothetical protein F0P96_06290 [Hymenobacter busanensis]|uniref:Uncharacterized protein n=1 Tax=Hymenobacter busanensis TaxID=2607656 RepID=A0A7L5A291_9BACT|nr:hypothetical protein [Hymenobacter busanensis]KAA9338438.1 hypothetical protein F0P96_06290 [Hymenobacter busanensis]QHJ09135.1 hypothetical protein GUY19_18315 [Hymenobacter busanensis]
MSTPPIQPEISDVQKSIIRNNYKLTADKIIQILKNLRNNAHLSNRRWVWELMQNAKDVTNAFGRVTIEIRLTPESLSFRHNGDPFHVENITGLIQQVSSKASDSSDEEVTGKFGTGFISTHLLADVIEVGGVVKRANDQHRQFKLILDRSGTTSEALLSSISESLDRIIYLDHNEDEFPLLPTYAQDRTEADLHTEFCYVLQEEENHEAARAGIADLVHTLPGTLLNIPNLKIKKVRVSLPDGDTHTYQVTKDRSEDRIAWYTVSTHSAKQGSIYYRHYVAYETEELRLLAEVEDFESLTLVPPTGEQPMLYRDFPLIGSEKFHFPFALNGFEFFPTEPRDSIFLNGKGEEPTQNRALLEAAQVAALEFTAWLLEHNARNRFVLANTRIPEVNPSFDATTTAWYKALQTTWRKALLELPLVETEDRVPAVLATVRIPRLRANAKQEDNEALWELAAGFLGKDAVPRRELLTPWIKALGIEEEMLSWGKLLHLGLEDLLRLVAEKKTLAALPMSEREGGSEEAAIVWLNELYAYLAEQKQLDLLKTYAAVPNQHGELRPLDKLYVERADELIPAPILDVLHKLNLPWRQELARRDTVLPGYKHQDRGLREASAEINRVLKERLNSGDTLESAFLRRGDAQQILVDLLRLTSPSADDTTFRSQLFKYAQELLHFEEDFLPVESLKHFDPGKATQLLTLHLNGCISNMQTVAGLATSLNRDEEDAVNLLGRYLRFVAESGTFKPLLEFGNIVPNREGKLCAYKDLYNFGTPTQPLDEELLELLHAFDRSKPRWMPQLLMDGIGLNLPKGAYKFDELGNDIMLKVDSISNQRKHMDYRDQLLTLIDWCNVHQALAKQYLAQFHEESGRMFYILNIEKSGKGSDVIKLLRQADSIADLVAITESGTDVTKLRKLAQLTSSDAVLDQVLKFAANLEGDVASFKFLQSIGAEMERAFKEALMEAGVTVVIEPGSGTTATVAQIDYHGIGSYDFAVRNLATNKAFYIELKSFKKDNPQHIRLAQSQAKRAAKGEEPFALCVVGRDRRAEDVTAEHVRQELVYVKDLQSTMEPIAKEIEHFEQLYSQTDAPVWFDVSSLHQSKVFVTHEFIDARRNSFDALIQDIKAAIL